MLRNVRTIHVFIRQQFHLPQRTFLTNEYKCSHAWANQSTSNVLKNVNLNDFYNLISQNHATKGLISAVDVDIFANAVKEPVYLEELKDLLHRLRLSAETGNTLESTHHATIRNYLEFGNVGDLISILKDPLNFGIFLDYYTANMLLDKLLVSNDIEQAANVAGLIMLQEEYNNDITVALCQYASFKFLANYIPPEKPPPEEPKKKKEEEIKIRVKYLRNPYYDDHFDIQDTSILAGKTLAWLSIKSSDNLNTNLQVIGWLAYKKNNKLLSLCKEITKNPSFKVYKEVLTILEKNNNEPQQNLEIEKSLSMLKNVDVHESSLETSLKNHIENCINKSQTDDISKQKKMFESWTKIREEKLEEQIKRLDRAKKLQLIKEKQMQLEEEEQKLWFFDNEDKIDLQIEEKEKLESRGGNNKKLSAKDEEYIPPEITPKKK